MKKTNIIILLIFISLGLQAELNQQLYISDSVRVGEWIDLKARHPELTFMLVWVKTSSDKIIAQSNSWRITGKSIGIDTIKYSDFNGNNWAHVTIKVLPTETKNISIRKTNDTLFLNLNDEKDIDAETQQPIGPKPIPPLIFWQVKNPQIIKLDVNIYQTTTKIKIKATQVGNTILYARRDGGIMPNGQPIGQYGGVDSLVIVVKSVSPCGTAPETETIESYCSNQLVTLKTSITDGEWFSDASLLNALGSAATQPLQIAEKNINIYIAQRQTSCLKIIEHRLIEVKQALTIDQTVIDQFDTICMLQQYNLPYTDIRWFHSINDSVPFQTGTSFPSYNAAQTSTLYLQRTLQCASPLYPFKIVVRNCQFDFTPKYFAKGTVRASGELPEHSVILYLINKNAPFQFVDSCFTQPDNTFTLRVPTDGDYTIHAKPLGIPFFDTYYPNKLSIISARYFNYSNLPDGATYTNWDITLLESSTTSVEENMQNYSIKVIDDYLQINADYTAYHSFCIYNSCGVEQANQIITQSVTNLPLSNFSTGLLIVKLESKTSNPLIIKLNR